MYMSPTDLIACWLIPRVGFESLQWGELRMVASLLAKRDEFMVTVGLHSFWNGDMRLRDE